MLTKFLSLFFLSASHLSTAVVSVHTHAHPLHTRTPHTHLYTNSSTTTYRSNTASFLRSPESSDSVGDGRVTFPLWLHARDKIPEII